MSTDPMIYGRNINPDQCYIFSCAVCSALVDAFRYSDNRCLVWPRFNAVICQMSRSCLRCDQEEEEDTGDIPGAFSTSGDLKDVGKQTRER